jgi:hypothetical protein
MIAERTSKRKNPPTPMPIMAPWLRPGIISEEEDEEEEEDDEVEVGVAVGPVVDEEVGS